MSILIKKMTDDSEIKGKAYVHWKSWQETYTGIIDQSFLDDMTLEKYEARATQGIDYTLIAKDDGRVIGFVVYGQYRSEELLDTGEIYAIYLLADYYHRGIGLKLMNAALEQLKAYKQVAVWVLKDNRRAINFYEKCDFRLDDAEDVLILGSPVTEVRMIKKMEGE